MNCQFVIWLHHGGGVYTARNNPESMLKKLKRLASKISEPLFPNLAECPWTTLGIKFLIKTMQAMHIPLRLRAHGP